MSGKVVKQMKIYDKAEINKYGAKNIAKIHIKWQIYWIYVYY